MSSAVSMVIAWFCRKTLWWQRMPYEKQRSSFFAPGGRFASFVQQQNYGEELQDLLTCSCLSFMKQVLSPYNLTCSMLWFSPGAVLAQAVHSSSLICKHLRSWNSAKSSETSQEFHSYAHKACWNPRNVNRAGITFPLQVLYTGKVWPHWLFALINLQHSIFDCHLMFVFAYRLQTQGVF